MNSRAAQYGKLATNHLSAIAFIVIFDKSQGARIMKIADFPHGIADKM